MHRPPNTPLPVRAKRAGRGIGDLCLGRRWREEPPSPPAASLAARGLASLPHGACWCTPRARGGRADGVSGGGLRPTLGGLSRVVACAPWSGLWGWPGGCRPPVPLPGGVAPWTPRKGGRAARQAIAPASAGSGAGGAPSLVLAWSSPDSVGLRATVRLRRTSAASSVWLVPGAGSLRSPPVTLCEQPRSGLRSSAQGTCGPQGDVLRPAGMAVCLGCGKASDPLGSVACARLRAPSELCGFACWCPRPRWAGRLRRPGRATPPLASLGQGASLCSAARTCPCAPHGQGARCPLARTLTARVPGR
jgi:hypothetical protein